MQTSWLQQVSVAVNDPTECLEFSKTLWARARGDLLYGKLVVLVSYRIMMLLVERLFPFTGLICAE
jgi:hypothetical protein